MAGFVFRDAQGRVYPRDCARRARFFFHDQVTGRRASVLLPPASTR